MDDMSDYPSTVSQASDDDDPLLNGTFDTTHQTQATDRHDFGENSPQTLYAPARAITEQYCYRGQVIDNTTLIPGLESGLPLPETSSEAGSDSFETTTVSASSPSPPVAGIEEEDFLLRELVNYDFDLITSPEGDHDAQGGRKKSRSGPGRVKRCSKPYSRKNGPSTGPQLTETPLMEPTNGVLSFGQTAAASFSQLFGPTDANRGRPPPLEASQMTMPILYLEGVDPKELEPKLLASPEFYKCKCGHTVKADPRSISDHNRGVHLTRRVRKNMKTVVCYWENCEVEVQMSSLAKHVALAHMSTGEVGDDDTDARRNKNHRKHGRFIMSAASARQRTNLSSNKNDQDQKAFSTGSSSHLPPKRQGKPVNEDVPLPFQNTKFSTFIYVMALCAALLGGFYTWRVYQWKTDVGGWWNLALGRTPAQAVTGAFDTRTSSSKEAVYGNGNRQDDETVEDRINALADALGMPPKDLAAAIAGAVKAYVPPASLSSIAAKETGEVVNILTGGDQAGLKAGQAVPGSADDNVEDAASSGGFMGSFVGLDEP